MTTSGPGTSSDSASRRASTAPRSWARLSHRPNGDGPPFWRVDYHRAGDAHPCSAVFTDEEAARWFLGHVGGEHADELEAELGTNRLPDVLPVGRTVAAPPRTRPTPSPVPTPAPVPAPAAARPNGSGLVGRRAFLAGLGVLTGAAAVWGVHELELDGPTDASTRGDAVRPPDGVRVAADHPFDSTSIWALPIVTAPVLEAVDGPITRSLRSGRAYVNQGKYGHQVFVASEDDPVMTITDKYAYRSTSGRVPADAVAAGGSDRHVHVLQPDGHTLMEMIRFERVSDTEARVSRVHKVDLRGTGLGPANGVRAYGGSAIGGLIRAWEVDRDDPRYTGRIDHPLAWALSFDQLKHTPDPRYDKWQYHTSGETDEQGQPGWPVGEPRFVTVDGERRGGFMKRITRWPATEEDHGAPGNYAGEVVMGTYFCIPGDVDPEPLDLSPAARMVFDAMQNYGGYVVDTTAGDSSMPIYVENGSPSWFREELLGSGFSGRAMQKIRDELRVVTLNDHENPNGGPLDAPRRRPLLPQPA